MNIPWQFVSIFFGRYDGDLNGLEGSGTNMEWADVRCVGGSISRQILIRFPLHAFTHITVHHRYPVKSGNVPPLEHGKLYGNIASYEIISPWYCWDIPCCAASLAGCPWCQDLFKEMFGSEDPFADFNKFFQDAPWILEPSATLCKMWRCFFFCLWGLVKRKVLFCIQFLIHVAPSKLEPSNAFCCAEHLFRLDDQVESPSYPSHIHWPRARNMQIYTDIQHMAGTAPYHIFVVMLVLNSAMSSSEQL